MNIGKSRALIEALKARLAHGEGRLALAVTARTVGHYRAQFTDDEWARLTVIIVDAPQNHGKAPAIPPDAPT